MACFMPLTLGSGFVTSHVYRDRCMRSITLLTSPPFWVVRRLLCVPVEWSTRTAWWMSTRWSTFASSPCWSAASHRHCCPLLSGHHLGPPLAVGNRRNRRANGTAVVFYKTKVIVINLRTLPTQMIEEMIGRTWTLDTLGRKKDSRWSGWQPSSAGPNSGWMWRPRDLSVFLECGQTLGAGRTQCRATSIEWTLKKWEDME